jgi:hypothetical protein
MHTDSGLSTTHAPSAARVPAAPRVPMASVATADLRAELKRRRKGEDNHITIKCRCERRRNLEGRNLKKVFGSLVPM